MSKYLRDFVDTDTLNVFYPEVEVGFELVEDDMIKTIKKFNPSTFYNQGEVVINGNKFYSAKVDFTSGLTFNILDWNLIEISSEQVVRIWNFSTTYLIGENVIYNGRIFRAIQNNTNQTPSKNSIYWDLSDGIRELKTQNKDLFLSGETYLVNDGFNHITFRSLFNNLDQTNKGARRIISNTLYPFVYISSKHFTEQLTFTPNQLVIDYSTFKFYKVISESTVSKTINENPNFGNTLQFEEVGINLDNYYTKTEIDNLLNNYYTKAEIQANYYNKTDIDNIVKQTLSKIEFSGFVNNNAIDMFYTAATRTIQIQALQTGKRLDAYYAGEEILAFKNAISWVSDPHPEAFNNYFLYYGPNGFEWSTTPWKYNYCMIAYVNYGSTNKFAIKETHGLIMDPETHEEFHDTIGTYLTGGADLSNFVLNSTTPANRRPFVSQTFIKDEDNRHVLPPLNENKYTARQILGPGLRILSENFPDIVNTNAENTRPFWNREQNGQWDQVLMNNGEYQAIFLVAVPVSQDFNSLEYRYLWVQGQQVSTDLNVIRSLTPANLFHGDGLSTEYVFVGKIIIRYQGGNWFIVQVDKLLGTRINQIAATQLGTYLSFVSTDGSLQGAGTPASPLSVNETYIDGLIEAKGYLEAVSTDGTLTGDGTALNPLSVSPNIINNHNTDTNAHTSNAFTTTRSNKDSNGIFTTIEVRRADNTLFIRSVLSNPSAGNYLTRTETIYLANGSTVQQINVYTLTYDVDGDFLTETLN